MLSIIFYNSCKKILFHKKIQVCLFYETIFFLLDNIYIFINFRIQLYMHCIFSSFLYACMWKFKMKFAAILLLDCPELLFGMKRITSTLCIANCCEELGLSTVEWHFNGSNLRWTWNSQAVLKRTVYILESSAPLLINWDKRYILIHEWIHISNLEFCFEFIFRWACWPQALKIQPKSESQHSNRETYQKTFSILWSKLLWISSFVSVRFFTTYMRHY